MRIKKRRREEDCRMSIVSKKYRGKEIYGHVHDLLVQAASRNRTVYYGQIGRLMGLEPGETLTREVGHILGEINEEEHGKGKPMLSAVVINAVEKTPGEGFFRLAEKLDKYHGSTEQDRMDFWREELQKVYANW
jgi:hypothetical protein